MCSSDEMSFPGVGNVTDIVILGGRSSAAGPTPAAPSTLGQNVWYAADVINLMAVPVIIVVGLVSNVLAGLVFIKSPLKVHSSSTVSSSNKPHNIKSLFLEVVNFNMKVSESKCNTLTLS